MHHNHPHSIEKLAEFRAMTAGWNLDDEFLVKIVLEMQYGYTEIRKTKEAARDDAPTERRHLRHAE
jgi:hypothetical protein